MAGFTSASGSTLIIFRLRQWSSQPRKEKLFFMWNQKVPSCAKRGEQIRRAANSRLANPQRHGRRLLVGRDRWGRSAVAFRGAAWRTGPCRRLLFHKALCERRHSRLSLILLDYHYWGFQGPGLEEQGAAGTVYFEPGGAFFRSSGSRALAHSQVLGGRFAAVFPLFVTNLCTLIQAAQTGLFDRRDVHEYVFATVVGLNESVSFGWIKPLNSTCSHVVSPAFK
ncbi:hypothetical protein ACVIGB_003420 [Bradyrhizobium sp. USDA 4341]